MTDRATKLRALADRVERGEQGNAGSNIDHCIAEAIHPDRRYATPPAYSTSLDAQEALGVRISSASSFYTQKQDTPVFGAAAIIEIGPNSEIWGDCEEAPTMAAAFLAARLRALAAREDGI